MTITSKHGAIINGKRYHVLSSLRHDRFSATGQKFVLFREYIVRRYQCTGLTNVVLLRNLSTVEMAQTIGRVIRLDTRIETISAMVH